MPFAHLFEITKDGPSSLSGQRAFAADEAAGKFRRFLSASLSLRRRRSVELHSLFLFWIFRTCVITLIDLKDHTVVAVTTTSGDVWTSTHDVAGNFTNWSSAGSPR